MKRLSLHTTSSLWVLGIISGIMSTAVLAQTNDFSPEQTLSNVGFAPLVLAQTEAVLSLGSTGSDVKDLQAMLALMGYYSGAVDGIYEQMTLAAVSQFQTDAGLIADGVVGPLTWQQLLPTIDTLIASQSSSDEADVALTPREDISTPEETPNDDAISATAGNLPILQLDDVGSEVSRLQSRLADLNIYQGPIDGIFGLQTEDAVARFQSQTGLDVDGVVGPATWLALFE